MEKEIYKADPKYRKLVLGVGLLFAVVGMALLMLINTYIKNTALETNPDLAIKYMSVFLNAVFLPILGFAVYLIYIAYISRKQDRYPPEGLKVVKDVELLRGLQAQRKAAVLMFLAIALFLCCLAGIVLANMLLHSLLGTL